VILARDPVCGHTGRVNAQRAPARLKLVGILLVVVGAITVIGPLAESYGMTSTEVLWNLVGGGVSLIAGLGLAFGGRWAWPIALVLAAAAAGLGIYTMAQPGIIVYPGAFAVAFILLVVPGTLIGFALLSPVSLNWFRGHHVHPERDVFGSDRPDKSEGLP
jgi:hypothetical protein